MKPKSRQRLFVSVLIAAMTVGVFFAFRPAEAVSCPTSGTDVVITVSCDLASGSYTYSGTLTVNPGVTVTALSDGASTGVTIIADTIRIDGTLSADGQGSAAGSGTGAGGNGNGSGGGGGHGGGGGNGTSGSTPGSGGATHGSVTQPTTLGSGGGDNTAILGQQGVAGGGAIKLQLAGAGTGTVVIAGTVSAAGNPSTTSSAGAGAGGSVWIDAPNGTITGGGTISASGGAGNSGGGGGGGGRVAVYYTTDSATGTRTTYGGTSTTGQKGGAGTMYLKSASAANGDLVVDNNSNSGAVTTQVTTASQTFDNVTIKGAASYTIPSTFTLTIPSGGTLAGGGTQNGALTVNGTLNMPSASYTFSGLNVTHNNAVQTLTNPTITNGIYSVKTSTASFTSGTANRVNDVTVGSGGRLETAAVDALFLNTLTVNSGGTVTHATNTGATTATGALYRLDVSATSTITVNSGGAVNVDGKGFEPEQGDGKGTTANVGGGAAYGGDGGDADPSFSGGAGGTPYGSVTAPADLGSGGGDNTSQSNVAATAGGGAVKLSVNSGGTLTMSGTVSANGISTSNASAGAGSGGSIWLNAPGGTVTGSGTLTASGGGNTSGSIGANGGGGRIAVYYSGSAPSLTYQAYGGSQNGFEDGGAGTIYLKSAVQTNGDLTVDNNSVSGEATTQVTTSSQTYDNLAVKGAANYTIPNTFTLTVPSGGTITGGGTQNGNLTVDGTLNVPSASFTFSGINIIHNNAVQTLTNPTITNGAYTVKTSTAAFTSGAANRVNDVTVGSGGRLETSATATLFLNALTVNSGGAVTHATNTGATTATGALSILDVSATSTITVNSGGAVNVDGKGFPASEGTGQGADGVGGGGGGGYGGAGGTSTGSGAAAGGGAYGSADFPTDLGSGGGDNTSITNQQGVAGGGAVKLFTSSATLTVNGTISAGGATATGTAGGGGSGGSIWLNAATYAGTTGTITANGGSGQGTNGGCGGGGRIAVSYAVKTYSGGAPTVTGACSGSGVRAGADGTSSERSVKVTAPNGGDSLSGGSSFNITWTSSGTIDHFRITLSTDGGATYPTTITSSTPSSPFAWTVNNLATSTARIKIEALTSGDVVLATDESDANFTISTGGAGGTAPPAITLNAPNGGERLSASQSYSVFWSYQGETVRSVTLSLSVDSGTTYSTIVSGLPPSAGFYSWTVGAPASTSTARMRAQAIGDGGSILAGDASDNNFEITVPVPEQPAPAPPPPTEGATTTPPVVEAPPEEPLPPAPQPLVETRIGVNVAGVDFPSSEIAPKPGDTVTFVIVVRNPEATVARNRVKFAVRLALWLKRLLGSVAQAQSPTDATLQDVMLVDTIPAGSEYVPHSLSISGIILSDADDGDGAVYRPETRTAEFALGDIPSGGTASAAFRVTVLPGTTGPLQNVVVVSAANAPTVTATAETEAPPPPPPPPPEEEEEAAAPEETPPPPALPPPAPEPQPEAPPTPAEAPTPTAPEAPPAPPAPPPTLGEAAEAVKDFFVRTPETMAETPVLDAVRALTDRIPAVGPAVRAVQKAVKQLRVDPEVQTANTAVVTPAAAAAVAVSTTSGVGGVAGLLRYGLFLVTQPLALLDRRKRRGFGVVYNSATKLPVDLAIIRLIDAATGRPAAVRVTDKQGRYLLLAPPGIYKIEVRKPNFVFPPLIFAERPADAGYEDLYFGGTLSLPAGGVLTKNIPAEPVEDRRSNQEIIRASTVKRFEWSITVVGPTAALISYIVTPRPVQIGAVLLHLALYGLFYRLARPKKPKNWGAVRDDAGRPIRQAVVRIIESQYNRVLESQMTDAAGRYAFLVGQNRYLLKFEKTGFQPAQSEPLDFTAKKEATVAAVDVELKPTG